MGFFSIEFYTKKRLKGVCVIFSTCFFPLLWMWCNAMRWLEVYFEWFLVCFASKLHMSLDFFFLSHSLEIGVCFHEKKIASANTLSKINHISKRPTAWISIWFIVIIIENRPLWTCSFLVFLNRLQFISIPISIDSAAIVYKCCSFFSPECRSIILYIAINS